MLRIILFLVISIHSTGTLAQTTLVAVASNMTHVMTDIAARYRSISGKSVKLTFGSSGNFTRQIRQGAPYNIFLSAAEEYVDILSRNELLQQPPVAYARGQIGLFIPRDSRLYAAEDLSSVFNALYYGDYRRIAIANPEHAPYGVAAVQSLQSGGLWAVEKERLLVAENAAQVVQYTLSGGVDVGIIPASFAKLPVITEHGRFLPIPPDWHQPIQQYLALIHGAGKDSRDFYQFLLGDEARALLTKSGYVVTDQH
jgi:molybdate transport system substrate-binding protein